MPLQSGPFDPPPDVPHLTEHDRVYATLYLRLLDADAAGVDWRTAGRDILGLNTDIDTDAAKRTFDAFMSQVAMKLNPPRPKPERPAAGAVAPDPGGES